MARREITTFYSIKQVAAALGVSVKTVRNMIKDGRLVAHRIGRQHRIGFDDYNSYLAIRRGQ